MYSKMPEYMRINYNIILEMHQSILEPNGQAELPDKPDYVPIAIISFTNGFSGEPFYANNKYYVMFRAWNDRYGASNYESNNVSYFVLWVRVSK